MRILNVEPRRYGPDLRCLLARAGDVDYIEVEDETGLLDALSAAPYDALITRLGLPIGQQVITACPSLEWVLTPTTGVDHLDIPTLEKSSVRILSLRGEMGFLSGVRSTAEHTWALLLALVRRLPAAHADVLSGGWRREPFLAAELQGKRLGLVGVGRLGGMVAGYAAAFRMRVTGYDRDAQALARAEGSVEPCSLGELLASSDVVSLHLPLDEATRGFLSSERLALLKPGALLVNTARGELVDEEALLRLLEQGHLGGAALDVLSGDGVWPGSVPAGHPLVRYASHNSNLILTPHVGGYGRDSLATTRQFLTEKFLKMIRKRTPAQDPGGDP